MAAPEGNVKHSVVSGRIESAANIYVPGTHIAQVIYMYVPGKEIAPRMLLHQI